MLSLLEMSVTGGVLIAATVVLRAAAGARLPRQTFLTLWGVALARLLLPFSMPCPASVYRGLDALDVTVRRAGVAVNAGGAAPFVLPEQAVERVQGGGEAFLLVWGAAALSLAAFFLLSHLRGRLEWRTSLPAENSFIADWLAGHPLRRRVQVRFSDRIDTPLTYGVVRPVILLPKELAGEAGERLSFVLAHEMAHIRRWDALAKLLLCAGVCVHWFNPLVWVMLLLAGRDLEVACDQSVVRMHGPGARGEYARTLLDLESRRTRFSPLTSGFSKNALEERIGAIMKSKTVTTAGLIAAVVLVAVVTAVFATTAPGRKSESPVAQAVTGVQISSGGAIAQYGETWIPYTGFEEGKADPETGHFYTKAQYDAVAALKTQGYESLSIAQFNRTLYAALYGGSDTALVMAYDMVLNDIPREDPLASFLLNTAQASLGEYQNRLNEVFSGEQRDASFRGQAGRTETADVYGDRVEVGFAQASYTFYYRILDQDHLTVQERDNFLQSILDGMQAWLDGRPAKELTDRQAMKKAVEAELDRLGKAASTAEIVFICGAVEDYYGEAYCEDGGYAVQESGKGAIFQGAGA